MNEFVKQSIDGRKMAFSNSYELSFEYQKKVDELFKKIEELGKKCNDALEFENKFAASSLNMEYTNLFTEIASNCKCIIPVNNETEVKSNGEVIIDEVKSDLKYAVDDLTMPARRKLRDEIDSKIYDSPLGNIKQAGNTISLFKKIFKK